ncbi:MAG: hypothetical protein GC191_19850 [Azospirillum sp.]|nr:hypothetical protein [Azospirillum sp.]
MNVFLLLTGSGALAILTTYGSAEEPALLRKLTVKGIDKFLCYQVPLELAKQRYGNHFDLVSQDLGESDDLRVLDYSGERVFRRFRFDELGPPLIHEPRHDDP